MRNYEASGEDCKYFREKAERAPVLPRIPIAIIPSVVLPAGVATYSVASMLGSQCHEDTCNTKERTFPLVASVLRHLGIHPIRPSQNAACQIADLAEACLAQEVHGLGAAHS